LSVLVNDHAIDIVEGATEAECLSRVRGEIGEECNAYFTRLTHVWQQIAYGHRQPPREKALLLCRDWPNHFGVTGAQ
jgi:hypothetical protein